MLPGASFFGLGGAEMAAAGMDCVVRSESVAHMGITEVIAHMPGVYAKFRRLSRAIAERKPDVAVVIDFPDVNFRLAKKLKAQGVPVVYFVSPQLWAWKRSRLRWVQQRVAKMMVIFPFEEPFYRARGVEAEFVGHPLAELPLPGGSREEFARQNHIAYDQAKPWVALLPGSRMREVRLNLPAMLRAATLLGPHYEYLIPVASTLKRADVAALTVEHPLSSQIHLVSGAREALFHARAAVVASGTATVQAAVIGTPFVVVYRVSPLTFWAAKRLVRYPAEIDAEPDEAGNLPVGMVNLVAGKRIVPELLQDRFTPENLARTLQPLLADGPVRRRQMEELTRARRLLQANDVGKTAIQQVRDTVIRLIG